MKDRPLELHNLVRSVNRLAGRFVDELATNPNKLQLPDPWILPIISLLLLALDRPSNRYLL